MIAAGNWLATGATFATVASETISGKNQLDISLKMDNKGIAYNSQVTIGSGTQVSTLATVGGWMAPISFLSLGMQTAAVAGDLGIIAPPPIQINTRSYLSTESREKSYYNINAWQQRQE